MAFKDALKDITHMLGDPEVKNILGALGRNSSPGPGAEIRNNLTVPFGLSFEQGQALRSEAAQKDEYAAARMQAQKAADIEAQKVALEGRRVTTQEQATAHQIKNDNMTESQAMDVSASDALGLESMRAMNTAQENQLDREARTQNIWDNVDAQAAVDTNRDNSPRGLAEIAGINASTDNTIAGTGLIISQTAAQDAELALSGRLVGLKGGIATQMKMQGISEPTVETTNAVVSGFESLWKNMEDTYGPEVDIEATKKALMVSWYHTNYMMGAIPVSMFSGLLPDTEYLRMVHLDNVWKQAKATGDLTQYNIEKQRNIEDYLDDNSLNNSVIPASIRRAGIGVSAPQDPTTAAAKTNTGVDRGSTNPDNIYSPEFTGPISAGSRYGISEPTNFTRAGTAPADPAAPAMTPSAREAAAQAAVDASKRQDQVSADRKKWLDDAQKNRGPLY